LNGENRDKIALILTGGGARGAYQAGVVKAIAEISSKLGIPQPFDIITGVSAGAINAAQLASQTHQLDEGTNRLVKLWENVTFDQVFQSDVASMSNIGLKLLFDMLTAPMSGAHFARSLLNTKPLRKLISENVDFAQIQKNIDNKKLHAVSLTATDYTSSNSISFVQGREPLQLWDRQLRKSERALLRTEHIMASSAIPLFFPPVDVDGRHFGDGCLRNQAPLSPAIHLGAQRLIVIGVRKQPPTSEIEALSTKKPSLGRVISVLLNAILLDGVDSDIERLARINNTLSLVPQEKQKQLSLKPIDFLWISPSEDIGKMAQGETWRLPAMIKFLIKGLGPANQASGLISYLLFDPTFCTRLTEMGYKDAMNRRPDVERFLQSSH
jgi:NTE family protein